MNRRLLKNILVASFIFFATDLFSQKITLNGIVTDTVLVGISNAYITITLAQDSSFVTFKLTEPSGKYQITLSQTQKLRFVVSSVGFENYSQIIDVQRDSTINFTLKSQNKTLDEVQVIAQRPASFKEDTATFNANFYRSPADKNLNDLLKKLPGLEVNQGKIFVQGQEVKNLMVEGEELYENNPKLLSAALSAEMVDKIQILDNFQDPNNPNGLNTNKKAINIKIREDKKNLPTGTLMAGGGVPENYLLNTNLFLFKPATKWNVLANTNNVGKSIFTLEDFLQFSGKLEEIMSGGGGNLQLSSEDLPQGIFQENVVSPQPSSSMLAVSLAHQFSKNFKLKNHTIFNRTSAQDIFLLNRFYSSLPNSLYSENQQFNRKSSWIESKTSLRFAPSKKDNIVYNFKLNYTDNLRNSDLENQFLNTQNLSNETKKNTQMNVSNQLLWVHNFSTKHIFSLDIKYNHFIGKNQLNITASEDAFSDLISNDSTRRNDNMSFVQNNELPSKQSSLNASHKWLINKKWTLNGRIGWNQALNQQNFSITNNELKNDWNLGLLDQTSEYNLQKIFADVNMRFQYRRAEINIGTSINSYDLTFLGKQNQININTVQFEPSLIAKLKFSQSHVLSLGYNFSNNLPENQQLNEVYNIESFRRISRGNRNLSITQRHNFNVQYYLFDLFNHVNAVAFGRVSLNKNPVRSNAITDAKRDISSFININQDLNAQGNISFGKDFYALPISIKVGTEWTTLNSENLFNGLANPFTNETLGYSLSLRTRFKGVFNIESSYRNTLRSLQTSITEKPLNNNLQKISTVLTLKPSEKLLFNIDLSNIQLTKENTTSANLTLLNLLMEYNINEKILLRAEGYNLLNNRTVGDATISPFYSQVQTQQILGSYGLLSLEYRF